MDRRKVLLVDGYNVIRNNERYNYNEADFTNDGTWNKARQAVVNDAAVMKAGSYERCTVVFDGAGNPSSTGMPRRVAGIDVVFSPAGVSADTVIEKLAHDAREEGLEVVVVSSDFTIQSTVFGGGVTRMSAAGFGLASAQMEQDWHEDAQKPANVKNTLAERVGGDMAAKLKALRDSL